MSNSSTEDTLVVSFDLEDAEPENYELAYKALEQHYLFRWSPNKQLRAPDSTVAGRTTKSQSAEDWAEELKSDIEDASKKVCTHILVGITSDAVLVVQKKEETEEDPDESAGKTRMRRRIRRRLLAEIIAEKMARKESP